MVNTKPNLASGQIAHEKVYPKLLTQFQWLELISYNEWSMLGHVLSLQYVCTYISSLYNLKNVSVKNCGYWFLKLV